MPLKLFNYNIKVSILCYFTFQLILEGDSEVRNHRDPWKVRQNDRTLSPQQLLMLFCGNSGSGHVCQRPLAICYPGLDNTMAENKPNVSKTLEVVGVGEVEVRPQLATITLILSACKQSLEECRASIDKRQPYVHHTVGGTLASCTLIYYNSSYIHNTIFMQ